ncbi:MAG: hypothetical protein ABH849_02425 [Nanoarchaeota archaeon]
MSQFYECAVAKTDRSYMPSPYQVLRSWDTKERLDEMGTKWREFPHFFVSTVEVRPNGEADDFRREVGKTIEQILENSKRMSLRKLRRTLSSDPKYVVSKKQKLLLVGCKS